MLPLHTQNLLIEIITPCFQTKYFSIHQNKMKTYSTNISYLFNRQQWSFDLQSSQCQDTVQQEGATTNQMQIKLYAESYDNNTYISLLYWIELISTTFNSAFGILKYAFKVRWRKISKVCDCKSMKEKSVTSISDVLFFFFSLWNVFFFLNFPLCRNIPFVWVNLLCQRTRRSPNVMGYVGTWKPSLSGKFCKQIVLWLNMIYITRSPVHNTN